MYMNINIYILPSGNCLLCIQNVGSSSAPDCCFSHQNNAFWEGWRQILTIVVWFTLHRSTVNINVHVSALYFQQCTYPLSSTLIYNTDSQYIELDLWHEKYWRMTYNLHLSKTSFQKVWTAVWHLFAITHSGTCTRKKKYSISTRNLLWFHIPLMARCTQYKFMW